MGSRTKLVKVTNDREAIWAWWEVFGVGFAKKFGSDEEQDESNAEKEDVYCFHFCVCVSEWLCFFMKVARYYIGSSV